MPFFSVIIPTYNRGHMIPETIGSVQKQSFENWECIIVDDGSTDNTKEVISKLAETDSRIKYVYQENAERSVARNNGIRHSKGNYVCFLDSDDQYCENYLSHLNDFLSESGLPNALVVSDFYLLDDKQSIEARTPSPQKPIAEWLLDHPVSPTRVCVSRQIFNEFKFDERILIVEDTVLWISIISKYHLHFIPEPLVKYRLHEANSVNRKTSAWAKREAGLRLFFRSPLSHAISIRKKKEMLTTAKWRVAEYHALNNRYVSSMTACLKSILMMPNDRHTKAKLYLIWQNLLCLVRIREKVVV